MVAVRSYSDAKIWHLSIFLEASCNIYKWVLFQLRTTMGYYILILYMPF